MREDSTSMSGHEKRKTKLEMLPLFSSSLKLLKEIFSFVLIHVFVVVLTGKGELPWSLFVLNLFLVDH